MPIHKHYCSWEKPAQTCPVTFLPQWQYIIWFCWALATIIWEDKYLSKTQDRKEENNQTSKFWSCSEGNEHRNCSMYRETCKSLNCWAVVVPDPLGTFLQPTLKPQPPPPCCCCHMLKITLANVTCLVSCCEFAESKHEVFPNTTPEELVQAASMAKVFFSCSVVLQFWKTFQEEQVLVCRSVGVCSQAAMFVPCLSPLW